MRYKRRINYIDAVRWTGENKDEIEKFANGEIVTEDIVRDNIVLTTPNGKVMAKKGDWICRDAMGKLYPCNSEVFRVTYVVDNETDIEEYEEEDYESDLKKELLARTELKPCPFCGSTAKIREEMDGRSETYSIHCIGCDMHYTKFIWRARDKRDVVKEWNQRVDE